MDYTHPGLYRFSLTVCNGQATSYIHDERAEVETVTICLGTRECMDEATLRLRPAEARRLAEALIEAVNRGYTPDDNNYEANVYPVVGIFDNKYNTKTGLYDAVCYTCDHEWVRDTHKDIEECPNCGVKAEERW